MKYEKREPMNLTLVEKKLREGFAEGKTDEQMSKDLKISVNNTGILRRIIGLKKINKNNVFQDFRTFGFDRYHDRFKFILSVPPHIEEKLKINKNQEYQVFAIAEPKKIILELSEKD
jgi:hypothetical protein